MQGSALIFDSFWIEDEFMRNYNWSICKNFLIIFLISKIKN